MQVVVITPTNVGNRGQYYRVTYLGRLLVESTRNPEFDACRALFAQGITGKLAVWRRGAAVPCMTLDIERGAGLTTCETDKDGLRLVRWRPFLPVDARNAFFAVRSAPGSPPTLRQHLPASVQPVPKRVPGNGIPPLETHTIERQ
jgi:hypothetical protein